MKRRRVFRALVGWGIFSFAILQVFEPVMHGLHLPEWTLSAVVVVLAAGFPATIVLSWIFDLGPGGVERTPLPPPDEQGRPRFGRKRLAAALVLVGVLAAVPGLGWWFLWHGRSATPAPVAGRPVAPAGGAPTVAVLPLVNISGDSGQDYFGDGITEEITSKLSRLRGLVVTARTSAARYKGSPKGAREIGSELGVAYLVEGTVRRAGDRVRVNASLVRTSDAAQVWSEDQDARIDDIFAVQDRLAARIVEALGLKLTPLEEKALANWGTRNAKAYDEYLKGQTRYGDGADDPTVLRESIAHLEKALAIDPDFAPAVALLGQATALRYRDFDSSPELRARAEALAARAMALDPQLPGALKAAGDVRAMLRFDYVGAAPLYRRVVEVTPRDHMAWDQLCWTLGYAGPPHLEEGEQACRRALALQPQYFPSHYHLLRIHVQQGRSEDARQDLAALEAGTDSQLRDAGRFWFALGAGRPAEALAATEKNVTNLSIAWQAMAHAQLGETDRAFERLEEALAAGYADGNDLRKTRFWEPLRSDPRWAATLRKHGIDP